MTETMTTLRETTRPFGANAYLEISTRELRTPEGGQPFVVIARGFYSDRERTKKRWTKFVTMPHDADLLRWLATQLQEAADLVEAAQDVAQADATEASR